MFHLQDGQKIRNNADNRITYVCLGTERLHTRENRLAEHTAELMLAQLNRSMLCMLFGMF